MAPDTDPPDALLLRAKHGAFVLTGARPQRENTGSEPRALIALVKLTPFKHVTRARPRTAGFTRDGPNSAPAGGKHETNYLM